MLHYHIYLLVIHLYNQMFVYIIMIVTFLFHFDCLFDCLFYFNICLVFVFSVVHLYFILCIVGWGPVPAQAVKIKSNYK